MNVIWKGKSDSLGLINGKTYQVLAIEKDWYRIIDETGEDYLFPPDKFEIIKNKTE